MLRLLVAALALLAPPAAAEPTPSTRPEARPSEAPGVGRRAGAGALVSVAAPEPAAQAAALPAAPPRLRPEPRPAQAGARGADAVPRVEALALRRAIGLMREGRWTEARAEAARAGEVAEDVVLWHELRARRGSWAEAEAFLARRSGWPGLPLLRDRAEGLMPVDLAPERVLPFFAARSPATGTGVLRLADALRAVGEPEAADATLVEAWRTLPMSAAAEDAMLERAQGLLAPHHEARLDALLWEDPQVGALRAMARVGPDWQALARARIGLRGGAGNVDTLIAAVPERLADDAGLAYERFRWRLGRGREEGAIELMLARSVSGEALGRPELWAERRERWARERMRAGQADVAYRLAAGDFLREGTLHADLQWLAGFVALTDLGDPQLALTHFDTALDAVWTPISLGRMHYWRGRALEALGREAEAMAAYREGGRHQTAFYGQLAAERGGVAPDPAILGASPAGPMPEALARNTVLEAADLLLAAGEPQLAALFLAHLAESQGPEGVAQLGAWAQARGEPYLQVKIGKAAAQAGVVVPEHYFPLHPIAEADLPVDAALALAIARRESEFHPGVASGAGAQGLMQLMPATAREVAGQLGLPYSRARLTSDPAYNATLGSAYLLGLEARFGRNVPMVAAGYNAGPGRPARWARERGDPRAPGVDAVDWIEHIPFDETRNYVMRVMESVPLYRMRLKGALEPWRLGEELKSR